MYKCKWFRCSVTIFFPLVMFAPDVPCQLTFWSVIFSSILNMQTSWLWLQSSENKNRTQFFRTGRGSWSKAIWLNISATNHKRKALQGNISGFFSQVLQMLHLEKVQVINGINQSTFFQFRKKVWGITSFPLGGCLFYINDNQKKNHV